jgi:anti-sigma-K factor RskA
VNTQEYISSGIVESYVLGLASSEEQLEFEQRCAADPGVQAAKEAFELSLEQYAVANAVPAPVELKQKIWAEIEPASGQVINMHRNFNTSRMTPVRTMNWAKFAIAAAVILLVGSTALNFYFYRQYQSSISKYEALFASTQQVAKENKVQQARLDMYESSLRLMNDSNMAVIALKGVAVSPSSLTTLYWDKQTKDVYVHVNNLPQPASDKQYQLWAIVDGKPVDAGIFDMKDAGVLVKMKNIPRAQAFAITLEKKGGSAAPTLTAMYVMGQV